MKETKSIKKIKAQALVCMIVGGVMFFQAPVMGQAATDEEYSLDKVVVTANRVPTQAAKSGANVTVITREQIENGQYLNLGDVLRDVNGVIVSGKGFLGAAQSVRLNGDDRVLFMIDGRKIGRPEGGGGRSTFDPNTIISMNNIERIEIVKGGASALYGSDAVGGVINIITRKGAEDKTTLDFTTGSWGTRNYKMSTQAQANGYSLYITADKKHQDYSEYNVVNPSLTGGSNKGDTYRWSNSEFDGQGITLRLDKEIDANHSWTVNFEHWNDEGGQPNRVTTQSSNRSTHLTNNIALTYNFNQVKEVPGFIRAYSNYQNMDFSGTYKSRTQGLEYQTGWQLDENNTLVAGLDWIKGTVLENTGGGYADKAITNQALYLQDIYHVTDKLIITPGLRYDHHSKFGGQTTPKLNASYSVDNTTDVYVAYNRVFNAPNLDDLYYYSPPGDSWGGMVGNPDLKPESGHVISAGVNKKISDATLLKLYYFASKLSDAIAWKADDPNDYLTDYRPQNIDKQKKRGFEIDLHHKISEKYYTEVGYSHVHIENNSDGAGYVVDSTNSQPNGYRVKLGYSSDQWNFNINGQGVSGRDTSRFIERGHWVWNMAVNYKMNDSADIYMNAFNITNEAYELLSGGTNNSRGNYPMAARNVQLGVKYSF
ncbi:TonB-dependent receptor plug domain-containing protein [Sporomusa termitida]|uniref:Vitamin B12 transporter BtuB n=1 Tax=Sporomusa termitida TaxID=2377 RepID=A0A517DP01_9FIRM|nr:TonB-dependent receptor [Sporomusa termitida]QDR79095.1 Vitamin B12 transporter BtuB [Sporomusa termitida]